MNRNEGSRANPDELKQALRPMAERIASHVPPSCGFALFLYHLLARGHVVYLSNAQRDDMLKLLREHLDHIEALPPPAHEPPPGDQHHDESYESRAFRQAMQDPFRRIHRVVKLHVPDEVEYAVLIFDWAAPGHVTYNSSVPLDKMLTMTRAWLAYAEKQQQKA